LTPGFEAASNAGATASLIPINFLEGQGEVEQSEVVRPADVSNEDQIYSDDEEFTADQFLSPHYLYKGPDNVQRTLQNTHRCPYCTNPYTSIVVATDIRDRILEFKKDVRAKNTVGYDYYTGTRLGKFKLLRDNFPYQYNHQDATDDVELFIWSFIPGDKTMPWACIMRDVILRVLAYSLIGNDNKDAWISVFFDAAKHFYVDLLYKQILLF
jgi:hypothetical protein